jgi:hypothetical protein
MYDIDPAGALTSNRKHNRCNGTSSPNPPDDTNWLLIVGLGIIFLIIVIVMLTVMARVRTKKALESTATVNI